MHAKTPTVNRLLVIWLLLWSATAAAQDASWSADDAVARALSNPELQPLLDSEVGVARAEMAAETALPTPRLGLSHEQLLGGVETFETSLMIEQQVDWSSWRARLRDTLPHREAALLAETEQWKLEVATAVRMAFYEVRYREERIKAFDIRAARLESGVAATAAREGGGDLALYDVRRVEREMETARAQRALEVSHLTEARGALRSLAPWSTRPDFLGVLPPDAADSVESEALPEHTRLEHLESALDAEAEAWGSPFWRGWVAGAGYRFADEGSASGHGFLVSVSVPLTLWNTDEKELDRLQAERARVGAELRLGQSLAVQAEEASRERLKDALEAISLLSSPDRDSDLTRLAEVAYAAGEASLTELLDAYESETDLQLARIDLQWEARRAAIELDRRLGLGVPK